jgi:hypothetical protein
MEPLIHNTADQQQSGLMHEGVIALLDVLGWKGVWQRKPNALQEIRALVNYAQSYATRMADYPEEDALRIEVVNISDTIAIIGYMDGHYTGNANWLIVYVSSLISGLMRHAFIAGLPLRGAISVGKFDKNDNSLVGPAVDEVAAWYEACDWVGVIFTPSANLLPAEVYRGDHIFGVLYDMAPVVEYDAPMKGGKYRTRCINWPIQWFAPDNHLVEREDKTEADLKEIIRSMIPLVPEVYLKYQNTLVFYEKAFSRYFDEKVRSHFRVGNRGTRRYAPRGQGESRDSEYTFEVDMGRNGATEIEPSNPLAYQFWK